MSTFSVTILGSSGALPAYGRFTSSQYLTVHHHHFLIDCGEGCQHQLRRYDLGIHKINNIFISHLHGDHYLGLMGLLFSMHLLRREHDLHIYSFRGLEEIILAHLRHSMSALNFKIIFHPLNEAAPELIFENNLLTVHSFPLDHKIPTCGFLFREKTRSRPIDKSKLSADIPVAYLAQLKRGEDIVNEEKEVLYRSSDFTLAPKRSRAYAYCSDSQPAETIWKYIQGVDLLYHEATFLEDEKDKARETKHSTAAEAATVAKQACVGKLLIGHFSARYKDLNEILAEAQQTFPATALAIEGETFELAD